ncbi:BatD family protein [Candidatus Gracilibacteria bacterium]|nr:BatD family protein [Candidatus Gracilibacteria bacterium]
MRHIFFIITLGIISITSAFAETTINFSSDKKSYDIEDIIGLQVTINTDTPGDNQIYIQGAETFQIISKRESHSSSNINGKQQSSVTLNLGLLAEEKGIYKLGPVSVSAGDEVSLSNAIEIEIVGERIMVNNKFDTIQKNLGNKKNQGQDNPDDDIDINDVDLSNTTIEEDIVPKTIIGVDGEEMTDIYTEEGFLYSYAFIKKILSILALIIVFILAIIIGRKYLQRYLELRKHIQEEEPEEIIEEKVVIDYQKLITNIRKNYLDSTKELFYHKTGEVYRTYLDDKVQQGLSKGSLKEVQGYFKRSTLDTTLKEKLEKFYKKIYFPEYNNIGDNPDDRESILEELEKLIIIKEFK